MKILGRRENQGLELKAAAVLEDPRGAESITRGGSESIAREAVAMLNASGGEIWIGIREENHIAVEVEPLDRPEEKKGALRDALLDRISPTPLPEELRVEAIEQGGGKVLRVSVAPTEGRSPYAVLKAGGWWGFPRRVDDRLVPMSREDIFTAGGESEDRLEKTVRRIHEEREAARKEGPPRLWLRFLPVGSLEIEIGERDPFEGIVLEPELTGNRKGGFHFARSAEPPKPDLGKVRWAFPQAFRVEIEAEGGALFMLFLSAAYHKGERDLLWPFKIIEYPISAFRIMGFLFQEFSTAQSFNVVTDLSLFGARNWKLPGGNLWYDHWDDEARNSLAATPDLTWPVPLIFSKEEIQEHPDRCGFRWIRRIYEAFGYREDQTPNVYDREAGRLVFPE